MNENNGDDAQDKNPFDVPMPITGIDYIAGEVTAPMRLPLLIVVLNKIEQAGSQIEIAPTMARSAEAADVSKSGLTVLIRILLRALSGAALEPEQAGVAIRVLENDCMRKPVLVEAGMSTLFEKTADDIRRGQSPDAKRRPLIAAIISLIIKVCAGIEKSFLDAQDEEKAMLANRSMIAMLKVLGRAIRESELQDDHMKVAIVMLHDQCMCRREANGTLVQRTGFKSLGLFSDFQLVINDLNTRLPAGHRIKFER